MRKRIIISSDEKCKILFLYSVYYNDFMNEKVPGAFWGRCFSASGSEFNKELFQKVRPANQTLKSGLSLCGIHGINKNSAVCFHCCIRKDEKRYQTVIFSGEKKTEPIFASRDIL